MATLTATAAASTTPAKYAVNGNITRHVSFRVPGTALSAGDVIQMVRIPAGACINDVVVGISCTAQSYTVATIGDGGEAGRYFGTQSLVLTQMARMSLPQGFGYSYSVEDTIDIAIGTITSGTAADAEFKLFVSYTMDR